MRSDRRTVKEATHLSTHVNVEVEVPSPMKGEPFLISKPTRRVCNCRGAPRWKHYRDDGGDQRSPVSNVGAVRSNAIEQNRVRIARLQDHSAATESTPVLSFSKIMETDSKRGTRTPANQPQAHRCLPCHQSLTNPGTTRTNPQIRQAVMDSPHNLSTLRHPSETVVCGSPRANNAEVLIPVKEAARGPSQAEFQALQQHIKRLEAIISSNIRHSSEQREPTMNQDLLVRQSGLQDAQIGLTKTRVLRWNHWSGMATEEVSTEPSSSLSVALTLSLVPNYN
jgi:hypothetical protein